MRGLEEGCFGLQRQESLPEDQDLWIQLLRW